MLATHSGIYDALRLELIVLALLGLLILGRALQVFRQRGLGPRVVALGLLALLPIPVGAWAATEARFRNRCVEHHSDIPLCDGRQRRDPDLPATEWAPSPPPAPVPTTTPYVVPLP